MKKLLELVLVLGILPITIISCSDSGKGDEGAGDESREKGIVPEGWESVEREDFSIAYPPQWELDMTGDPETEFAVYSELEGETDEFRENVNIVSEILPDRPVSLDEYLEATRSQLEQALVGFEIQEEQEMTDDFGKYRYIVYHANYSDMDLAWKQQFRIVDGKAYVLTYSAERDNYSTFSETADQIFSTFHVK